MSCYSKLLRPVLWYPSIEATKEEELSNYDEKYGQFTIIFNRKIFTHQDKKRLIQSGFREFIKKTNVTEFNNSISISRLCDWVIELWIKEKDNLWNWDILRVELRYYNKSNLYSSYDECSSYWFPDSNKSSENKKKINPHFFIYPSYMNW